MEKVLENYPFKDVGVTVAEGFAAYDGVLRDVPGRPHRGIDYVLYKGGEFASFEVFNMFEGSMKFGVSDAFGKYMVISKEEGEYRFDCVYAHLDFIDENLQKYAIIQGDREFIVPLRYSLGWASATGNTKSIRQLHIELHRTNLNSGEHRLVDPYGVYDRASSGRYPQPGQSLSGLNHFWVGDSPSFAA